MITTGSQGDGQGKRTKVTVPIEGQSRVQIMLEAFNNNFYRTNLFVVTNYIQQSSTKTNERRESTKSSLEARREQIPRQLQQLIANTLSGRFRCRCLNGLGTRYGRGVGNLGVRNFRVRRGCRSRSRGRRGGRRGTRVISECHTQRNTSGVGKGNENGKRKGRVK